MFYAVGESFDARKQFHCFIVYSAGTSEEEEEEEEEGGGGGGGRRDVDRERDEGDSGGGGRDCGEGTDTASTDSR